MQEWLELMKRVGVFMILGEMLIHLVPGKEYEKYLRFVLDLMILVLLFVPVLGVFQTEAFSFETITAMEEGFEAELEVFEEEFGQELENRVLQSGLEAQDINSIEGEGEEIAE